MSHANQIVYKQLTTQITEKSHILSFDYVVGLSCLTLLHEEILIGWYVNPKATKEYLWKCDPTMKFEQYFSNRR